MVNRRSANQQKQVTKQRALWRGSLGAKPTKRKKRAQPEKKGISMTTFENQAVIVSV